jgi:hypothetical protein
VIYNSTKHNSGVKSTAEKLSFFPFFIALAIDFSVAKGKFPLFGGWNHTENQ